MNSSEILVSVVIPTYSRNDVLERAIDGILRQTHQNLDVIVVDDYSNSCPESLKRIEKITGKAIKSYETDIKNKNDMRKVFGENQISCVIHFAGLKSVGESIAEP